jgi:hypothetical protein
MSALRGSQLSPPSSLRNVPADVIATYMRSATAGSSWME